MVNFVGSSKKSLQAKAYRQSPGFSLVELLTVLAITALVSAFAIPAFTGVKDADIVTNASYTISATLQRARAYAMAHNTYTWVGFYEERADASSPTQTQPPYAGIGRVVIGMVASIDGTQIFANAATPGQLPASGIFPIDKVIRIQNIHVTDLGAPTGGASSLAGRPNGAYLLPNGSISTSQQYGINSDDSTVTNYPFTLGSYTFYKTIRFSPSGEASINGSPSLRRVGEIGVRPSHNSALTSNTPNVVAIQFTGIGGGVQIYRK